MKDRVIAGKLWSSFEEPDVILLHLEGQVSLQEAEVLNHANRDWAEELPYFLYLIDMGGDTSIGAEVRKSVANALSDLPLLGTAIYNAPFATAVVAKLLLIAVNRRRRNSPITVHATEQEAREWLMARREQIIQQEVAITDLDRSIADVLQKEGGSAKMGILSLKLNRTAAPIRARLRLLESLGFVSMKGDRSAATYALVRPLPSRDTFTQNKPACAAGSPKRRSGDLEG